MKTHRAVGICAVLAGCSDAATAPRVAVPDMTRSEIAVTSTYSAEELPLPTGSLGNTNAVGINDGGDVVGLSDFPGAQRPVLWVGSTVTDLGLPPFGALALVGGINNSRTIVGTAVDQFDIERRGFIWQGGTFTVVPAPFSGNHVSFTAINAGGVIAVNYNTTVNGFQHAGRYTTSGGFEDLHPAGPYTFSAASAINDRGDVAGGVMRTDGHFHAAFWSASGVFTELGLLPGGTFTSATGVNDNGAVVGSGSASGSSQSPFRWTSSSGLQFKPWQGQANAISSRGRMVGARVNGVQVAGTSLNNQMTSLPLPPGTVSPSVAMAVNRCGSAAGIVTKSSRTRAVRWTLAPCDP